MDNYREISDVYRKVSLASIGKPHRQDDKLGSEKKPPKDTFMLVHILFLLLGVLNLLPLTFFTNANDYWMYKFRDISKDKVDLNNKTTLQTYFTSGITVVQTVPSIATMILSAIYGSRFKVNSRIILTLSLKCTIFVLITAFVKINTDTWQVTFFVFSLLAVAFITGVLNLLQVTSMAVVPKFPPIYMKTFLLGQGMSSIFSASLQIISLALGTSSETSALFYFVSGIIVITTTFILYLIVKRKDFYSYYIHSKLEDIKKKHSKEEIISVGKKIWPILVIFTIIFITVFITHPSITSLIVSEYYGNGNKWNEVYFTPAITFLFAEICSQMGRLLARPVVTKSSGPWMVGLTALRMLILVPMVWFCNAQPRNRLPVLLPHDWEYILLCVFYFVSSGFLLSTVVLSIPVIAPEGEDVAYLIMLIFVGFAAGVLSPLSLIAVQII